MTIFTLIASLLFSCLQMAHADTYNVSSHTQINNGDWYPLTTEEMKAAAVDTALATLTKTGNFKFENKGTSTLNFQLTLMGSAETVKLKITLNTDHATYVSLASQSISQLGYQGIYKAFEYIGKEAADQLYDKLQLERDIRNNHSDDLQPHILEILRMIRHLDQDVQQLKKLKPTNEKVLVVLLDQEEKQSKEINPIDHTKFITLFNEAQKLKRKHQFRSARALFGEVVANHQDKGDQIVSLSQDELIYGIPIFQADSLITSSASKDNFYAQMQAFEQSASLLREVLANNTSDMTRTLFINKKLDHLALSIPAMRQAIHATFKVSLHQTKMALIAHFADTYQWADQAYVEQTLKRTSNNQMHIVITRYNVANKTFEAIFNYPQMNFTQKMTGDNLGQIQLLNE